MRLSELLKDKSKAKFVEYGYGQVEPNHLSAQRTGQIYAQLPAKNDIDVLEQGQFVKYNYKDNCVDFSGDGEWMLVFNEIKLYREFQNDCEFAMIAGNYKARVYSPANADANDKLLDAKSRDYFKELAPEDMYELDTTDDPFHIVNRRIKPQLMADNQGSMVPRVFKTNVGDIFTTNTVAEETLAVGDILAPNATGILSTSGDVASMKWQVVKVYTLPDRQKAVKIMRIA